MIQDEFLKALSNYSVPAKQGHELFQEIEKAYSGSKRYYHNKGHLESLLTELEPHHKLFDEWDIVIFAIVYHDIVYNVLKSNNEEKSGALAVKRLKAIGVSDHSTSKCEEFILATKSHQPGSHEVNLFTDADLSILGAKPERYQQYCQQIRSEYSVYPDIMYKPGRKKVLAHFLQMPRIFKTEVFYKLYEETARENLKSELEMLS
jgi:predicted metal-dependent HD superfamily phosphohydrolase